MNTPLRRIRRGAVVLGTIFVLSVLGYRYVGGYDWVHSVWMVVVTVSSVGYSETSVATDQVRLLSVGVIVLGMSATVYTVGGLIQLMLEGEIQTALGQQRTTRDVKRLSGHVVVCGFGRIGEMLARDLKRKGRPLVVIESDSSRIGEANQQQFLAICGDAMEEEVLVRSRLEYAKTVVSVLPNDAENVFITLTARNLNPDIQIIARAEHPTTEKKLRQAGADRVVMPAVTGATQMSRMITRPSTADLMELLTESSFGDMDMDEITISTASELVGITVAATGARNEHGVLVIAVKRVDNQMVFNPNAEYVLQGEDTVIVMGCTEDIEQFRKKCEVLPT